MVADGLGESSLLRVVLSYVIYTYKVSMRYIHLYMYVSTVYCMVWVNQ